MTKSGNRMNMKTSTTKTSNVQGVLTNSITMDNGTKSFGIENIHIYRVIFEIANSYLFY